MHTERHILWGAGLPQVFDSGRVDMALVGQFARRSEALGYGSLWVADMHLRPYPVLDPVVLLGYVAALTARVRLGTSVLISPVYNPILLARELASLDQMSEGRLTVGVGLGTAERLYPRYGISTARAVGRFVEGVRLMNALWTTSPTTFEGRYWNTDQVLMEPKPLQQPRPPLWFGGGHPNALRRAVRYADGWMGAGISTTGAFADNVQLLRRYCEESGRDPATFQIAKRIYVGLDATRPAPSGARASGSPECTEGSPSTRESSSLEASRSARTVSRRWSASSRTWCCCIRSSMRSSRSRP